MWAVVAAALTLEVVEIVVGVAGNAKNPDRGYFASNTSIKVK